MNKNAVQLGDKVKDVYTGFTGIAVARTEWLYGCARISIEPDKLSGDGNPIESQTFDEQRVEIIELGRVNIGGPHPRTLKARGDK